MLERARGSLYSIYHLNVYLNVYTKRRKGMQWLRLDPLRRDIDWMLKSVRMKLNCLF